MIKLIIDPIYLINIYNNYYNLVILIILLITWNKLYIYKLLNSKIKV